MNEIKIALMLIGYAFVWFTMGYIFRLWEEVKHGK